MELFGRMPEVELLGDREERPQVPQVHGWLPAWVSFITEIVLDMR